MDRAGSSSDMTTSLPLPDLVDGSAAAFTESEVISSCSASAQKRPRWQDRGIIPDRTRAGPFFNSEVLERLLTTMSGNVLLQQPNVINVEFRDLERGGVVQNIAGIGIAWDFQYPCAGGHGHDTR